jgi:hypothetical protein
MSSGERFPLVVDNHRRPLFDVTAFLLHERRPKGQAFNTLKAMAEAIRFLLTWARFMRIDLDARLSEGWLLSLDEIEDFTGAARLGFKVLAEPPVCPKPVRAKAVSAERVLRKPKRSKLGVDTRVARTRIRYIAEYLDWLVKKKCGHTSSTSCF